MTKTALSIVVAAVVSMCVLWVSGCVSFAETIARHSYPGAGKDIDVDFGITTFRLSFADDHQMSFLGTAGSSKGVHDTVEYTARELRPGLYMIYWHEPHTGDNVVHIQDFDHGIVHTNIAKPDGRFLHMDGVMKASRGSPNHD